MPPKILITNDDGLYSAGLKASYEALCDLGEVFAVAPLVQKSGVGRSMSIMEPIRVYEVNVNGIEIFAVDGTPTDAVVIGIHEIIGEVPDITISGINLGENLSTEAVTTSGTVCAALEAATQGSNAIAISMELPDTDKFELFFKPYDFTYAKEILQKITKIVLKKGMPKDVDVLNVNVPSKANGEIEITRLARKMYKTRIEKRYDPRGRKYYWISGIERKEAEKGTDIYALRRGKVSITPLSIDLTAKVDFNAIKNWLEG
ncbi:MAG TPA: 5'/3'-nucleotidase SurE [Archaeoglobus veneficus]|nr:5'/3'-nucleotidase SurE [Archaeoglobus veneficus]